MSTSDRVSLSKTSVLITGATGGIGMALVERCLAAGATVFAAGRNEASLNALQEKAGKALIPLCYDVTDEQAVKDTFRQLQRMVSDGVAPALFGLVNCAGVMLESPLSVTKMDNLKAQLNINLLAPYQHMQLASRLMSRLRRGSIVNVVSQVGEQGSSGMSAYAASKAALTGATKALAKELAPIGIRVNAVAPGFISTALTSHYNEADQQAVLKRVALGRAGTPEEVADAIFYLLSPLAGYTSGQVLGVDGVFTP
ncbi:SDR family NAD(P)-dependent oxidoreductase [Alteromonas gilva]|uniref:SDR family NAD(P)-dependent oxidoreductase n=1 Tax=Alteromonas gilva TaxID=2987522 RepID=A0ABT5L0B3_9ALTE|nr:SDR family NAD(P)-dependent oxidoreductase [Alteromonas gilva]MDC8830463.1 SDR family NAD(P)-dependent oxidoreductase [Alteromonas gilva]